MVQLKQETVSVNGDSQTVVLKRYRNKKGSSPYQYVIEDADTGGRIEDPLTNKQDAMREFNETVRLIRKGMKSERGNRGMGMGGGPPGLGLGLGIGEREEEDRDRGPNFPWM